MQEDEFLVQTNFLFNFPHVLTFHVLAIIFKNQLFPFHFGGSLRNCMYHSTIYSVGLGHLDKLIPVIFVGL